MPAFREDAAVIEAELRRDPEDPRLQFYLGQSWREEGEPAKAAAAYRVRADNPAGWDQERWYARFQLAVCVERLGRPHAEVAAAYLDAYAAMPDRAEPLVELSRVERQGDRPSGARRAFTSRSSIDRSRTAQCSPLKRPDLPR